MCVHLKISVLRLIWTLGLKFRFSLWASSLTQHWVKISIIHMGVNTCWCQIVANPLQYNIMTVDGCEILHHQEDGWKPVNNGMFTTYQLVQDFATIHSMAMKLKPEKGPRIDLHVFSIEHLVIGLPNLDSYPISGYTTKTPIPKKWPRFAKPQRSVASNRKRHLWIRQVGDKTLAFWLMDAAMYTDMRRLERENSGRHGIGIQRKNSAEFHGTQMGSTGTGISWNVPSGYD